MVSPTLPYLDFGHHRAPLLDAVLPREPAALPEQTAPGDGGHIVLLVRGEQAGEPLHLQPVGCRERDWRVHGGLVGECVLAQGGRDGVHVDGDGCVVFGAGEWDGFCTSRYAADEFRSLACRKQEASLRAGVVSTLEAR